MAIFPRTARHPSTAAIPPAPEIPTRMSALMNGWIEAMLVLYRRITGKKPGISIGGPGRPNRGMPQGPLIRFMDAAGEPLGLEQTLHGLRERTRLISRPKTLPK